MWSCMANVICTGTTSVSNTMALIYNSVPILLSTIVCQLETGAMRPQAACAQHPFCHVLSPEEKSGPRVNQYRSVTRHSASM